MVGWVREGLIWRRIMTDRYYPIYALVTIRKARRSLEFDIRYGQPYRAGLANLWHTERFPWHAAFTAVPIVFISFARPAPPYSEEHVCTYTHICVQTVYELPLLPNNTALKHFYTDRSGVKC